VHQNLRTAFIVSVLMMTSCTSSTPSTPATDQTRIGSRGDSAYGLGVDAYKREDYPEAVVQWRQAVAQGNRLALNNLGYLAYYGLGMQADPSLAVDLWHKGAALGVSEAQWHLGIAYQEGKGVRPDPVDSYAWVRCAIDTATRNAAAADAHADTELKIASDARVSLVEIVDKLPVEKLADARQRASACMNAYKVR
jgi:TPR repeat protein